MALRFTRVLRWHKRLYSSVPANAADLLQVSVEDGVKRITLHSSRNRNALSLSMINALNAAIKETSSVSCIVLNADGPVFSAGHNLKELTSEYGREKQEEVFSECTKLMETIMKTPYPILCQVRGLAAAAGCQLVAMCDIVIASEKAQFSTPGINFGLFCSTPGIPLVRAVPRKVAAYMLFTGLPISAQQALAAGLVSRVVPEEKLEEETETVVSSLKGKSRPVVALGKKFLNEQVGLTVLEAFQAGEKVMVDNLQLKDAQIGLKAFAEKKKPQWTHES